VFGYDGKQVRDNIHSGDVVRAFHAFHMNPRPGAVYNLGGGRDSNVSMIEAIAMCQEIAGERLDYAYSPDARIGDHRWWISDLKAFVRDYPQWRLRTGVRGILQEIYDTNVERWSAGRHRDAVGHSVGTPRPTR
jgi:CDP-paratose 2-epimerase